MNILKFSNGDNLPLMGLGTWLSKPNEVYNAVIEAIKCGYRHIDCAYIYGNEKEIGDALRFAFTNGLVKREEIFITSKLWNSDHAPERVGISMRKSLNDLQLDYLDLYLMHWPVAFKTGHEQAKTANDLASLDEIPLELTWNAMVEMKNLGLTKHVGVSNFNIAKLNKLSADSGIKPEVNQVELHPYFQQNELVEYCHSNEILVTAYSPLGSRHLIKTDEGIQLEKSIQEIAAKHKCSETQVMLAWGMQRNTSVIPKSVNSSRIIENLEAMSVQLDADDMHQISKLERGQRMAKGLYVVLPGGYYTYEGIWEK
ncbi:MAG TPA: aldo/keto reductase [Paludibacter sp.]|nr:aldo/keto reductase [Paludibacter sp.]